MEASDGVIQGHGRLPAGITANHDNQVNPGAPMGAPGAVWAFRKTYMASLCELCRVQVQWAKYDEVLSWGFYKTGRVEAMHLILMTVMRKGHDWRSGKETK